MVLRRVRYARESSAIEEAMPRLQHIVLAPACIAAVLAFALRASAESPSGYWTSAANPEAARAQSDARLAWNTPSRTASYRTRSVHQDDMPTPVERGASQGDDFQPDWQDAPESEYVGPRGARGGYYDEGYYDEGYHHGGGGDCCDDACCEDECCDHVGCDPCCTGCGGGGHECHATDPCACGQPDVCCGDCNPLAYWCWWENLEVFSGVHGFKGPVDLGVNGNFGFDYGLNWGFPIPCLSQ
jgi:hypothetical protein